MKPVKIKRALISVSDKTNLVPFARSLHEWKVEIISTGGTFEALKQAGIPVTAIDQVTGFPEMLEGRVKTLHPKIHGGLLFRRDKPAHVKEARKHGIEPIDMVVVNLYPFEKVTQNPDVKFETAIENIDIGGPSMLRSAAKNFDAVTVICDSADYLEVAEEMKKHRGAVSGETRKRFAFKVFERTSSYDRAIFEFFSKTSGETPSVKTSETLPTELKIEVIKDRDLRYGENPHQRAALYLPKPPQSVWRFEQLHGKELSYNNFMDIEAAMDVVKEFSGPAACVIKHNNPCGIAEDKSLAKAVELAIASDSLSAFGGILGINQPCDEKIAGIALKNLPFFEVFVAPSYTKQALEMLQVRKNLRIIATGKISEYLPYDLRFMKSGVLVQDKDPSLDVRATDLKKNLKVVTRKKLKLAEIEELLFAFKCVKVVKSNAIVLTQGRQTVGIGAGQMSRVDSVEIACRKAGDKTKGALLASDAFFPMPDSIETAHKHGIRSIIQPGGSIKDPEVIAACDQYGIAMILTGERHFKH
ncbi:MAG: bifunctional phosphoribosylaminoimidazolecarboxamide formyltransferase/IMP cyclohydrolase [Candidatus Omnitrophica bacterium]|nr:bifunctional phosphoribosylaminoimidazolecarboxamide formyltransferase/IMP cyclohydrolase [Candidatus Omnitrophota bacterium]